LECNNERCFLPYSYNYYLASSIYNLFRNSDEKIDLHINTPFKGYVFSSLFFDNFRTSQEGIHFKGRTRFYFSSINQTLVKAFLSSLLKLGKIKIKDISLDLLSVNLMEEPDFNNTKVFNLISPLIVKKQIIKNGKRYSYELLPSDKEFYTFLINNIKKRYHHITGKSLEDEIDIKFIEFKPKRYKIKDSWYRCSLGKLVINAPSDVLRIIYHTGLGSKNSMGFGMIEKV